MITREQEHFVRQEKDYPTKSHAKKTVQASKKNNNPTAVELSQLINDFNQGLLVEAKMWAIKLTQIFPNHGMAWKVLGVIYHHEQSMKKAGEALETAAALMPKDAEVHYNLANFYCDSNQLEAAKAGYQKAIKLAPGLAKAHFNLAHVLKDLKQFTLAETSYRKGLKLEPQQAKMHFYLGLCFYAQERFKDALKSFQKSLKLSENDADVYLHLGISHRALGNLTQAEEYCRKALMIDPQCADIYNQLAIILNEQGRQQETETAYLKAIELDTNHVAAHQNLGLFYRDRDKPKEAEACLRKALSIREPTAEALNSMAAILAGQDRYTEAEIYCRQALMLTSKISDIWNNFGLILLARMKAGEAQEAFEQALAIQPGNVRILSNYGEALRLAGKPSQAEVYSKKAIELDNSYVDAYLNLGNAYRDQGLIENAIETLKQSLVLASEQLSIYGNFLYLTTHSEKFGPESHLALAREYGRIVSKKAEQKFDTWLVNPQDQCLRVGVVSGDLRQHPVAYFLKNVIQHIDSSKLALVAYLTDGRVDSVSAELKPYFTQWKSLAGYDYRSAAEMIHADGIHVLLDLSGHTAGNKLPIFAWRPAPVQATWLGYWSTTGVAEIDYCLADEVSLPPSCRIQFSEKIKYLPDTRLCFSEPEITMEIAQLPAIKNGYVTLGCYQQLAKVGSAVMELWGKVMQAIPSARLRWQCKSFIDESIIAAVKQRLQRSGVDIERISLLGQVSRETYFASYAEVDMNLDTFPFTGGTTTCDALWMGVPTLTLIGNTMIARQGASLMTAAGLLDWVAANQTEYIAKVIAFSNDLIGLATLRSGLRARLKTSPLFDGARFAGHFETALQELWQEKCAILAKKFINTAQSDPDEQNPTQNQVQQDVAVIIEIVSATRMNEQDFWQHSALGQSLVTQLIQNQNLSVNVAFENTRGLSEVFNAAIAQADDEAILVFIHDDVWIDDAQFTQAVLAGLNQFDIIGVAGNKRRLPKQPAWAFIDTQFTWDAQENLSGKVAHGETAQGKISKYGDVPAECELLDGVFLAVRKRILATKQVAFDPRFNFHFYDLDFCRTARNVGVTLGTWPIQLTHQSGGAFGSESWQQHYQQYLQKWHEQDLSDNDVADVSNVHIFELTTVDAIVEVFNARQLYPAVEYTTQAIPIFGNPSPNPLVQSAHVLQHPPIYMAEVSDFKVIGNAAFPIVQDKCIQPQNFNPEEWETAEQGLGYCRVLADINLAGYLNLSARTNHDCKVISLIGNGAINYAHWLTEFLPQIVVLKQAGVDISQYRILVNAKSHPSQLESLYLLGVQPAQLIKIEPFSLHHFPRAMWLSPLANVVFQRPNTLDGVGKDISSAPDRAIYHPQALLALRNVVLDNLSAETRIAQPDKIFVKRKRGNTINARMLVNGDVIETLLAANGFVSVDPSNLHFMEQVTVFSNAKYIVATSDAAILNMLWAPVDSHVLVMMNDTRYANYWYFGNVAASIGQTLTYILGETLDAQLGGDIVHSDFRIDPQAVLDALQFRGLVNLVNLQQSLHDALQEVLELAAERQNAGDLTMAEQLYQEVLKVQPNHGEANHHLAVIETHTERLAEAIPRFELATAANPAHEQYWVSYVDALMLAGNVDKAVKILEIGQQFGLSAATAEQLAAEFVAQLEAQPPQNDTVSGKTKPVLATLVPAYKHAFIPQLLVSLATQSYPTGQIIISDDSPNGEVSQVIADPALAHIVEKLNITIIQGPKQGTMSNVVHLLEHWQQSSQLVHILFDDDILYPTFYAQHVQTHTQEAIGASVSYRWFTNELGRPCAASTVPTFVQKSTHQIDFIGADQLFASVVPTCDNWLGEFSNIVFSAEAVQLYKRSRMEGIAYYGLGDVGLLLEISLHSKVAVIKNYLGGFRQNTQQNTVNYNSPVFKCGTVAWVALALASYKLGKIGTQQLQQTVQLTQGAVSARFLQSTDMQGFIQLFNTYAADSAAFEQSFLPLWQQLLACKDWLHAQKIGQLV